MEKENMEKENMEKENMEKKKLIEIIQNHHKWLINDGGERANLKGANLRSANLIGVNLRDADLRSANLIGTYLSDANLIGVNLSGANLRGADLSGANLRGADLRGANLRDADLIGVNLRDADLIGVNLRDADLRDADLSGADLSDVDLSGAEKATITSYNQNCPEDGDFVAWKKVHGGFILKLLVIGDRVSPIVGRKCRTNKVKVLAAFDRDGDQVNEREFVSTYDGNFFYCIGEISEEKEYDPDPTIECSKGIHFFITKQEAMDW